MPYEPKQVYTPQGKRTWAVVDEDGDVMEFCDSPEAAKTTCVELETYDKVFDTAQARFDAFQETLIEQITADTGMPRRFVAVAVKAARR